MGRWLHLLVRLFGNHCLGLHKYDGLISPPLFTGEGWIVFQDFPGSFPTDPGPDQGRLGLMHWCLHPLDDPERGGAHLHYLG